VQVVTLGSGQVRTWEQPRAAWRPVLAGRGAGAGTGRTLTVAEEPGTFLLPVRAARRQYQPPAATTVTLLDTTAHGGGLASSPVRTLHAPAGRSAPGAVFLTPDGTRLIGSVETDSLKGGPAGELAVYVARTGKLLRTLAPWRWPGGSSPRGGEVFRGSRWRCSTRCAVVPR
jgi:hypothetical protein